MGIIDYVMSAEFLENVEYLKSPTYNLIEAIQKAYKAGYKRAQKKCELRPKNR